MRTIIMDVLFSTSISQHRRISRKYVILCYMFYTPNNLKHVCQFCAHLNITFHLLWTGLYHVESLEGVALIIICTHGKHIRHCKSRKDTE